MSSEGAAFKWYPPAGFSAPGQRPAQIVGRRFLLVDCMMTALRAFFLMGACLSWDLVSAW